MSVFRFMWSPSDFDRARAFLCDVVALDVVAEWDDDGRGAIFQAPGAQVEIFETPPGEATWPHRPDRPADTIPVGLAWEVDDVDAVHLALLERGANVVAGPADRPWGWRMMTIAGPDGVLVSLFSAD